MEKLKPYIAILIMLFINGTGHSQDAIQPLDGYLEMAARNNPEVKAAFNQYLAALEKVPQVGSLPDLQASFGFFIKPMELLGGDQIGNIQLMQMFPWFGTLRAAKDEASLMAHANYEAFNATKAELFFQVKSSWYRLMKFDRESALVLENIELLESLEKLALIKFQSPVDNGSFSPMPGSGSMNNDGSDNMNNPAGRMNGMSDPQNPGNSMSSGNKPSAGMAAGMNKRQVGLEDVLRVRMEILELRNRLALLADQRRTEEARFNALLNRDLDLPVQISDSLVVRQLSVDKLAIADSILNSNPMLAMLENETKSYALMEDKARKMGLPMLGVGMNYMPIKEREGNPSMMNGKDMFMPMVSVSIPIYRKKYKAMQNEARFLQESGNQQSIDLKNDLLVQYRQFVQNLDDASRRIALYQEQQNLAKKTTDLLISGFTTTGNDFEEVLRMQMKVLEYGFSRVEAIVDHNISLALAEMLMNSSKY